MSMCACEWTSVRERLQEACSTIEVKLLNRQYLQLTGAMDRDVWAKRGPSENRVRLAPRFSTASPDALSSLVAHEHEPQANA
jgi:hypothetical protein